MAKDAIMNQLFVRNTLVGMGIGLYFGLFFRPVRQPNIASTLMLAVAVTIVLVCIQAIRNRPSPGQLLRSVFSIFIKTAFLLLVLDARHVAYAIGGKVAVTIYTTVAGGLAGLWFAYDQNRNMNKKSQE
jgi:hypothetical protein